MRPVATVGQGDTPASWLNSLPIVTKTFLVLTLLLSGSVSLGFLTPVHLAFYLPFLTTKFEVWRLITPYFFAGKFSFAFLMHMMALYENCMRYERNPFNTGGGGTSADFIWMLCIGGLIFPIIGAIAGEAFFSESILFMIMYVWSRREPEGALNIFGFKFQALYLPWVYLALRLLMGNPVMPGLYGVGVGHFYYFLADVLPLSHNIDMIKTPGMLIRFVDRITGVTRPTGINAQAPGAPQNAFGGHNWGRGNRLGAQ